MSRPHDGQPPDVDPPAIGGLLRMAWQAHRDRMYRAITEGGHPEVTRAQFELFRWPGIDGLRPTDIAEWTGLSKQAVNDTLGDLERDGLLERHPDPDDGRARIVRLTERGRALYEAVFASSRQLEAQWSATLGERRMRALRASLEAMIAAGAQD